MELDEARAAALLDRRTTALATRAASRGAAEARAQPFIVWSLGESLFGIEVGAIAAVIPFAG